MTVIAVKGATMAADSGEFCGNLSRPAGFAKIVRMPSGVLFGAIGNVYDCIAAQAWAAAGGEGTPPHVDDGFMFVRLDRFGQLLVGDSTFRMRPAQTPAAYGAAHEFVYGALLGGAAAEEAVRLACDYTIQARGPVQAEWVL